MANLSDLGRGIDRAPLSEALLEEQPKAKRLLKSPPEPSHNRRRSLKRALHIGKDNSQRMNFVSNAVPIQADVQASYEEKTEDRRLNPESTSQEPSVAHKLIHDPIDTVKSLARGRVAEELSQNLLFAEVPHHHNVELVQAHAAVLNASDSEKEAATDRREVLLEAQQKELLLWTLNRHVRRVKVLSEESQVQGEDWKAYLEQSANRYGSHCVGYGTYPPPLSQDVLIGIAERILVVSVPLQYLATSLRRVYRWEDTYETLVYLLLFLLLWSIDVLLPTILFGMVVFVLTRHDQPPSLDGARQELHRVEDVLRQSRSFTEFATKQNRQDWLTPLGEALGPSLLIQLGDIASFLEIIQNFYEWRSPKRTAMSVILLAILATMTAGVPTWLLVRASTLSCGFIFFFCFPISSRYPDYRLLVSPKTWLFWKIPTHAEWAISVVQSHASGSRKQMESSEIARHGCSKGSLVITGKGLHFAPLMSTKGWELPYDSLLRMEKMERHTHARSGEDLKFTAKDGTEYIVLDVKERDDAFVQVIGFTDVSWSPEW